MKKKEILLPTKKYFKSDEEDLNIPINLNDNSKLLREGDKDIVLNISDLFDYERNQSKNYKIYGKIKMIFRNMYLGVAKYNPLLYNLYVPNENGSLDIGYIPYNEFALLRNDTLHEVNEPNTIGTINLTLKGTEYTKHTVTTNFTAPHKNWNLYLSYVYDKDTGYTMTYTLTGNTKYTFIAGDGIPFRVENLPKSYKLTSPVEHGMKSGEYIVLKGETTLGQLSGRTFDIISVGDETYNSEKYVLEIPKTSVITDKILTGKKCLDFNNITGTTSSYYVHKHKIVSNVNDYIIDKAGFETPIWEDERKLLFENVFGDNDVFVERNRMESLIYDFKEPFVLDNILNNLGYKFNFHDSWIDDHFSGTTSNEINLHKQPITTNAIGYSFSGGTEVPIGTSGFTGAFVEYNENDMSERIISEAFHKITIREDIFYHGQTGNTSNFTGATPDNKIGLYYQPYHRVKLRQLSPYIETSDTDQVYNLPENTKYDEITKLWKWHDLYDHGYIDPDGYGTNHPFTNNIHYVKKDINFYLRNEELYKNKTDGLINFNDINNVC